MPVRRGGEAAAEIISRHGDMSGVGSIRHGEHPAGRRPAIGRFGGADEADVLQVEFRRAGTAEAADLPRIGLRLRQLQFTRVLEHHILGERGGERERAAIDDRLARAGDRPQSGQHTALAFQRSGVVDQAFDQGLTALQRGDQAGILDRGDPGVDDQAGRSGARDRGLGAIDQGQDSLAEQAATLDEVIEIGKRRLALGAGDDAAEGAQQESGRPPTG